MRIQRRWSGFTLVELLVVLLIVSIVSAAVLPAVLDAWSTRRLRDGSALVHSTLNMVQAESHRTGRSGVRLIPDEKLAPNPTMDPSKPLVFSRMVALTFPAPYSEGRVMIRYNDSTDAAIAAMQPWNNAVVDAFGRNAYPLYRTLMIEEAVYDEIPYVDKNGNAHPEGLPNNPTNWFWNVRVGDKVTIAGSTFFVCGPTVIPPGTVGNPEGFVNVGAPGSASPLVRFPHPDAKGVERGVEFLLVTNGVDDDMTIAAFNPDSTVVSYVRGAVDDGWDGLDNDLDSAGGGARQRPDSVGVLAATAGVDEPDEREPEQWPGAVTAAGYQTKDYGNGFVLKTYVKNGEYTISRRPYPDPSKSFQLPASVVIDASGWTEQPRYRGLDYWTDGWGEVHYKPGWDYTAIRSRLPVDPVLGTVDVVFGPEGATTVGLYRTIQPPSLIDRDYVFWIGAAEDVGVAPSKITDAYVVTVNRQNGQVVAEQFDLAPIADGQPPPP